MSDQGKLARIARKSILLLPLIVLKQLYSIGRDWIRGHTHD